MNLNEYGFMTAMMPQDVNGTLARVTAVHKKRYALICKDGGEIYGRLKTTEYYKGNELLPTVGDFVLISHNQYGDCQIIKTLPRRTFFSRLNPTPGCGEQAIAANFDYVFIVQSMNHDFNVKRLERYLTVAWQSGATPVVVLTKMDLTDNADYYIRQAVHYSSGVSVYAVSSKSGEGMYALRKYMIPGKTVVFLGSSGVGKSSLINALGGSEIMAVSKIREKDSKGRHTTTHRQLIILENGTMIIDTPGMRELGMWDVTDGLRETFSDVEKYIGKCKFRNCSHRTEPGCAVIEAIEKGKLSTERWKSYLKLKSEAQYSTAKRYVHARKRTKQK